MKRGAVRAIREAADTFLGPARVCAARGRSATVTLPDGRDVDVEMAIPYEPAPGDLLLVIGQRDHWAIGVLDGRGKHTLAMGGDVSLRAVGGTLDLEGDLGVRIRAPNLEVHASTIETVARAVIETFATLHQRVAELLSVHARQKHTIVDEDDTTQARSAAIQTEETVTINGKQIHLG